MLNLLVAATCKMKQTAASDSIRVYQNSYVTLLINKLTHFLIACNLKQYSDLFLPLLSHCPAHRLIQRAAI